MTESDPILDLLELVLLLEAQTYRSRAEALLSSLYPTVEDAVDKLARSRFGVYARLTFRSRISGCLRRSAREIAQLGWESGGGSGKVPREVVSEYQQRQQEHLSGWFSQIKDTTSIPGGVGRARMYISSLMGLYNQAWAEAQQALGMPPLPAKPRDGTTICLMNCGCRWVLKKVDDVTYEAYWVVSAAESCPTCLCRARFWAPLTLTKVGGQWVTRTSGEPSCSLYR